MTAKAELEMAKRLVTSYKKHEELAARIADLESDK